MKFYRYETIQYANMDSETESISSRIPDIKIILHEFNLFRETPKGYWIGYGYPDGLHDKGRWVSKTTKKRYAYPTKKEALNNFIKRTEKRVKILNAQLNACEISINLAKNIKL